MPEFAIAAVNRAQDLPDATERMDQPGAYDGRTATHEASATMVKSELARYAKVIKAAGIRIELHSLRQNCGGNAAGEGYTCSYFDLGTVAPPASFQLSKPPATSRAL